MECDSIVSKWNIWIKRINFQCQLLKVIVWSQHYQEALRKLDFVRWLCSSSGYLIALLSSSHSRCYATRSGMMEWRTTRENNKANWPATGNQRPANYLISYGLKHRSQIILNWIIKFRIMQMYNVKCKHINCRIILSFAFFFVYCKLEKSRVGSWHTFHRKYAYNE